MPLFSIPNHIITIQYDDRPSLNRASLFAVPGKRRWRRERRERQRRGVGRVLLAGGEPAALDGAGRERGGHHDGPGHAGAVRAGHGSQAGGRRPPRHRQR